MKVEIKKGRNPNKKEFDQHKETQMFKLCFEFVCRSAWVFL